MGRIVQNEGEPLKVNEETRDEINRADCIGIESTPRVHDNQRSMTVSFGNLSCDDDGTVRLDNEQIVEVREQSDGRVSLSSRRYHEGWDRVFGVDVQSKPDEN